MTDATPYRTWRPLRPGLLIDRDGTLTVERSYLADPGELEPIAGSADAVAAAAAAGLGIGVVTNQSAIARGIVDEPGMARLHHRLHQLFPAIELVLHCPHHPDDGCPCRKPKPLMLLASIDALGLDPARTAYAGDHAKDVQAAAAAGVRGYLVRTGHGPDHVEAAARVGATVVADLAEAVAHHLDTITAA